MSNTKNTAPVVSSFTKPVRDAAVTSLARAAVGAAAKADAAVGSFLYAMSRHEHVGRKSSRGISVTLSDKSVHVIGTMTDAYTLIGLDKSAGPRALKRAALLADVEGVTPADVPLGKMSQASVSALFSNTANAIVREDVTRADVLAAVSAVKPVKVTHPDSKPETLDSDDSTETTPAPVVAVSVPEMIRQLEAIAARLAGETITAESATRLADVIDVLGSVKTRKSEARRAKVAPAVGQARKTA